MDQKENRYRAPALDKGLDILEFLAEIDEGVTQAEIAKQLQRNPNEFYRMLDRLVRRGYVNRTDGDRYVLSLKLFGLTQLHTPVRRLASFATPFMRELAAETLQANQLAVLDRGAVVIIAQQEAPGYWGISVRVGSHLNLYDTGSGHVLLAFRSQQERLLVMKEYSHSNAHPTTNSDFFERLERVYQQGYEMMPSAQTAGVYDLSAPVLGSDGTVLAALSIPYLALVNVSDAPDITETRAMLIRKAQQLTEQIGS